MSSLTVPWLVGKKVIGPECSVEASILLRLLKGQTLTEIKTLDQLLTPPVDRKIYWRLVHYGIVRKDRLAADPEFKRSPLIWFCATIGVMRGHFRVVRKGARNS